MAKQPNLTAYQQKIVGRYYDNLDSIVATKLSELVGSIALASTDKERDKLWKRAAEYLAKCKVDAATVSAICDAKDVQKLAVVVGKIVAGK